MGKGNRNRKLREENPRHWEPSSTERKLMEELIRKQILEQERRFSMEVDAAHIWLLYNRYGFTPEQCKQFFLDIEKENVALRQHYEIKGLDGTGWLYVHKLRDAGMEIESWYTD